MTATGFKRGRADGRFYHSRMCRELNSIPKITVPDSAFPQAFLNTIILGSCQTMRELPDRCLHLIITSPPYNVSKDYDRDLSLQEYLDFLRNGFIETYRVLVNGGRICVNISNLGRKPHIPLFAYVTQMLIDIGFNLRGEIVWVKPFRSTAWGSWKSASNPVLCGTHEYILIFSKGDYKRKRTGNDTITAGQFTEWTKSIWTMNSESARRIGHPAPFPVELPYRLIQLYSFTEDIVLDPYMGSGTTAVAALRSGRHYVGYETNPEYVELANNRIKTESKQSLLF